MTIEQDCVFMHDGREFRADGAVVTDEYVIGYPNNNGVLTDWHGEHIGTYKVLSSWATPRSYMSDRMYSIECFVNHVRYVGRGGGKGMILRAKRSSRQPRLG